MVAHCWAGLKCCGPLVNAAPSTMGGSAFHGRCQYYHIVYKDCEDFDSRCTVNGIDRCESTSTPPYTGCRDLDSTPCDGVHCPQWVRDLHDQECIIE